ncbi:hypothetical protein JST97_12240 [bacterium]|nr:hypothetical protein [bacterium]
MFFSQSLLRSTTLALALALWGCGSPEAVNPVGLAAESRQIRFTVPKQGGTVTLPATDNIQAILSFRAGAADNTELSLSLSETPPPGVNPDAPGQTVTRKGFYYILWQSNQSFDFSLIRSLKLQNLASSDLRAKSIESDAEVYGGELDSFQSGTPEYLGMVQGRYLQGEGATVFSQPDSVVMNPGTPYLFQAKSIQEQTIPMTIVNNSGVEPAYLCILGQNPNAVREGKPDPDYYHVSPEGKMVPFDPADRNSDITTDPNGKVDGYTDLYNIPLVRGENQLELPQMAAGRMYLSLGRKLKIRLEDDRPQNPPLPPPQPPVRLAQPNGWTNPGDPNYKTLFDWLEFDYKINNDTHLPGIGINKTEVDMMGFGVQFTLQGPTIGSRTVGTTDTGRQKIFEALGADRFFSSLIVPGPARAVDANGQEYDLPADIPLRVVAPVKGLENSQLKRPSPQFAGFDLNYFDQYLSDVWARYRNQDLICYTSAFGRWSGRVNAEGLMVFTCVDDNGAARPGFDPIYVRQPSTQNAFEPTELITSGGVTYQATPGGPLVPVPQPGPNDQAPSAGDDPKRFTKFAASEIVSAMSAAMNRTTLLHQALLTRDYQNHPADLLTFYKQDASTPRINLYAKTIHDHSLTTPEAPGKPNSNGGGAAYAFGFDDNSNQSSYLSELTNPSGLKVVITPLKP